MKTGSDEYLLTTRLAPNLAHFVRGITSVYLLVAIVAAGLIFPGLLLGWTGLLQGPLVVPIYMAAGVISGWLFWLFNWGMARHSLDRTIGLTTEEIVFVRGWGEDRYAIANCSWFIGTTADDEVAGPFLPRQPALIIRSNDMYGSNFYRTAVAIDPQDIETWSAHLEAVGMNYIAQPNYPIIALNVFCVFLIGLMILKAGYASLQIPAHLTGVWVLLCLFVLPNIVYQWLITRHLPYPLARCKCNPLLTAGTYGGAFFLGLMFGNHWLIAFAGSAVAAAASYLFCTAMLAHSAAVETAPA